MGFIILLPSWIMPLPTIIPPITTSSSIWSKYSRCAVAKKIELIITRISRLRLKNFLPIFLGRILGRILLHFKIVTSRQAHRHHALAIKKNSLVPYPWYPNKKGTSSTMNGESKPYQFMNTKIIIKDQPARTKPNSSLEMSNSYPIGKAIREV